MNLSSPLTVLCNILGELEKAVETRVPTAFLVLLFMSDMPSNCVKHKPDAWCMAGDFFFTSRNDRFRQIKINT